MYTSEGNRLRSIENQIGEQQKLNWAMLVLGLAIGFVGMYFFIARPMSRDLKAMKLEMVKIYGRVEELAAEGTQVWEANSLLASLKIQKQELEEARRALEAVRQLRSDVTDECDRARFAMSQVKAIGELHDRIVKEQPSVEIAGRTLDDISLLNDRLIGRKEATEAASGVLDRIVDLQDDVIANAAEMDQVEDVVRRHHLLQQELRHGSAGLNDAFFSLNGLVTLKHSLMNGAHYVEIAQTIVDHLLTMQQNLAEQGGTSELALHRARQLLELNSTLSRDDLDVTTAQAKLDALLQFQQTAEKAPSLSQAIESIEVLNAFQEEFIDQIQILAEMRKSLIEFGLMQSTIAKAMKTIQPLIELGNLQRMSDAELRSAARNILEERRGDSPRQVRRNRHDYESDRAKADVVPEPSRDE